jgi:hypothetical protein
MKPSPAQPTAVFGPVPVRIFSHFGAGFNQRRRAFCLRRGRRKRGVNPEILEYDTQRRISCVLGGAQP